MSAVRDLAKTVIDEAVPGWAHYKSNDPPPVNNQYELWTGLNHAANLLPNYVAGGHDVLTGCNGFVIHYANRLQALVDATPGVNAGGAKISGITHWFELHQSLNAIGKGHAWVDAAQTTQPPKYGDILRHTAFHVDVAIGMENGRLLRAGAGMPDGSVYAQHPRNPVPPLAQRSLEYDVLRRIRGDYAYNRANLQGWLDLDLFFGPATQGGVTPAWLVGWWNVTWRGQTWYYYFDDSLRVKWTQFEPLTRAGALPDASASDIGDVTIEPFGVATRWRQTGNVEHFRGVLGMNNTAMTGLWNHTEPVVASKM